MTLAELCEPIFQHACRLHRGARKGLSPAAPEVRAEVKALLDDARQRAAADPALAEQYSKVEIILLYFIDALIRSSRLPYAAKWQDLAAERGGGGQTAGDEDFFDQLDATLADPSDSATQRLGIFYTCLGLGFSGWYRAQPEVLRRKVAEIVPRIRAQMDADKTARVCPEAYESVNTADLVQPQAHRLTALGILIAGLALAVFLANIVLYRDKRAELVRALDQIKSIADTGTAPTTQEAPR
jgi:type IV/VI secretion system ImpK/VasF family protein